MTEGGGGKIEGWAVFVIYGFHKTQPPVLPSNMPFFSEHTTIAQLLALVGFGRVRAHTHTRACVQTHTIEPVTAGSGLWFRQQSLPQHSERCLNHNTVK